jgi:hypothetical protein
VQALVPDQAMVRALASCPSMRNARLGCGGARLFFYLGQHPLAAILRVRRHQPGRPARAEETDRAAAAVRSPQAGPLFDIGLPVAANLRKREKHGRF